MASRTFHKILRRVRRLPKSKYESRFDRENQEYRIEELLRNCPYCGIDPNVPMPDCCGNICHKRWHIFGYDQNRGGACGPGLPHLLTTEKVPYWKAIIIAFSQPRFYCQFNYGEERIVEVFDRHELKNPPEFYSFYHDQEWVQNKDQDKNF